MAGPLRVKSALPGTWRGRSPGWRGDYARARRLVSLVPANFAALPCEGTKTRGLFVGSPGLDIAAPVPLCISVGRA